MLDATVLVIVQCDHPSNKALSMYCEVELRLREIVQYSKSYVFARDIANSESATDLNEVSCTRQEINRYTTTWMVCVRGGLLASHGLSFRLSNLLLDFVRPRTAWKLDVRGDLQKHPSRRSGLPPHQHASRQTRTTSMESNSTVGSLSKISSRISIDTATEPPLDKYTSRARDRLQLPTVSLDSTARTVHKTQVSTASRACRWARTPASPMSAL